MMERVNEVSIAVRVYLSREATDEDPLEMQVESVDVDDDTIWVYVKPLTEERIRITNVLRREAQHAERVGNQSDANLISDLVARIESGDE